MAPTTATCRLCNDTVECTSTNNQEFLPGFEGFANKTALRWIVQEDVALMHHRCGDASVRHMIDPDRNWFACQVPDRAIDLDAIFDPFCEACEARWAADGGTLWNLEQPN